MDLKSGYPYWLIKNGLPYNYPKLTDSIRTDIAIIGGGISGALCAYELTKSGFDCVVIDARTIGLGSTCASTSLLQYELDIPLHKLSEMIGRRTAERAYVLCGEAIDELKEISKTIGCAEFELKKSLLYAAYKKDISLLQKEYDARKKIGFQLDFLTGDEMHNIFGLDVPAALLSEKGAAVNAYLLTHLIHQHTIHSTGCRVFDRTCVNKVKYHKKGITLVTAEGHFIHSNKIINASGYEIEHFIGKKIVTLRSTYAFASEQIPGEDDLWNNNVLIWNTADPYLYMRTTSDRRIIAGGRDEALYNPRRRDQLVRKKTKQLNGDVQKLFPQLNSIPEFSWTGTFGITKDSLPFIGAYNLYPHTYFVLGFGGNGITFSVIAAKMIRDILKGKRNKDVDLFRFDRV
jgi:glycine/D-amino acid oxidase-like deaminating enzyme